MNELRKYAEENKYELLSKFKTVKEFNNHFEQAMLLHKDKFTKSEYIALNKLRKFAYSQKSPKTIGVAWCKGQIAVAATHQEMMFGISRSSFDRMLRKAKKLNLVTVINQYRKNKYKKHNVYVFNRLDELTPEKFEKAEIVSKTSTIEEFDGEKNAPTITLVLQLPKLKEYTNGDKKPSEDNTTNEEERVEKKMSLRQRIANKLKKDKQSLDTLNEFATIAYGMIKKLLKQDASVPKAYLEDLVYNKFLVAISGVARNPFALFSDLINTEFKKLLGQDTKEQCELELDAKRGVIFKPVPEFMIENECDLHKKSRLIKNNEIATRQLKEQRNENLPDWFVPVEEREQFAYEHVAEKDELNIDDVKKKLKEVLGIEGNFAF